MTLKVIGSGFGRTGSHSLKLALEMLGLGPCYHMMEVFAHPGHAEIWLALGEGRRSDFEAVLAGFPSAVDWPVAHFWRELARENPAARIIHTERPPEEWYRSVSQTIFPILSRVLPADAPEPLPHFRAQNAMVRSLVFEDTFGGDLSKDNAIRVYERNNEEVRRTIPADRLLIFNPRQGWEPLCAFLGVPVPDAPYPKTNSTDEFRARAGL